MNNNTSDRTDRAADKPTATEAISTEAVRRLVDLIARRTAEQHADGEFEDAPRLSRRARLRKDR